MNRLSTSRSSRLWTCLPMILFLVGIASVGCKEDLDEARAALATTQRDRDALNVRVAGLEHELAAARAELARQKAAPPATPGPPCGVTERATADAPSTPAVAGKTGGPDARHTKATPSPRS
ncbi:MAG TPA: hypothetical protein VIU64_06870 [Polyangia bacterium]